MDPDQTRVSVLGYTGGRKPVYYTVAIKHDGMAAVESQKRYKQFLELHRSLSCVSSIKLPSKLVVNADRERRRLELERYLQRVLGVRAKSKADQRRLDGKYHE
jgi:hypothetical protein